MWKIIIIVFYKKTDTIITALRNIQTTIDKIQFQQTSPIVPRITPPLTIRPGITPPLTTIINKWPNYNNDININKLINYSNINNGSSDDELPS